jgi:hypothetical protein
MNRYKLLLQSADKESIVRKMGATQRELVEDAGTLDVLLVAVDQ